MTIRVDPLLAMWRPESHKAFLFTQDAEPVSDCPARQVSDGTLPIISSYVQRRDNHRKHSRKVNAEDELATSVPKLSPILRGRKSS